MDRLEQQISESLSASNALAEQELLRLKALQLPSLLQEKQARDASAQHAIRRARATEDARVRIAELKPRCQQWRAKYAEWRAMADALANELSVLQDGINNVQNELAPIDRDAWLTMATGELNTVEPMAMASLQLTSRDLLQAEFSKRLVLSGRTYPQHFE